MHNTNSPRHSNVSPPVSQSPPNKQSTPTPYESRVNESPRRIVSIYMRAALLSIVLIFALVPSVLAQSAGASKLPAPDRIIGDYLKATGGKKRLQAMQDATYEWGVEGEAQARARTLVKAPASSRTDIILASGETDGAANARTAWARDREGAYRTLTDTEAHTARLRAALDAGRLVDYKKQDVLARTSGVEHVANEQAYVVEFSRRNGARLRYYFGATTKLLLQISDDARGLTTRFGDYRASANGALEPHRVETVTKDSALLVLVLREARYNTGLGDNLFEPPGDGSLNVVELLREVGRNQKDDDERISEYTYTRTERQREITDKGEVKKEKVLVYEVYPVAGAGAVEKLISEDGVPLSAERAAKEEKRVAEEIEKLERDKEKIKQRR
ncbi:MAG: hypothetical protein QOF61_181, partial [Acidobacteriota bacterium]|nr:hypothetical protein [Acidobacteriota bacterium]